jgi:hypothetical protein
MRPTVLGWSAVTHSARIYLALSIYHLELMLCVYMWMAKLFAPCRCRYMAFEKKNENDFIVMGKNQPFFPSNDLLLGIASKRVMMGISSFLKLILYFSFSILVFWLVDCVSGSFISEFQDC